MARVRMTIPARSAALRAGVLLDALEVDILAAAPKFLAVQGTQRVLTDRFRLLVRRDGPRRLTVLRAFPKA